MKSFGIDGKLLLHWIVQKCDKFGASLSFVQYCTMLAQHTYHTKLFIDKEYYTNYRNFIRSLQKIRHNIIFFGMTVKNIRIYVRIM